jgi:hypothetical protein
VDKLTLHPKANDCLFQHYRALRNIFHDVLGHLELDYLSMILISSEQELIYFSSSPSLELNLIELNLWQQDPILHLAEKKEGDCLIWNDIYENSAHFKLRHYKMEKTQICFGLSLLSHFRDYKVIYSFGLYRDELSLDQGLIQNIDTLKAMGKFCLQNIFEVFTKDTFFLQSPAQKRHLYIVKPQSDIIY